MNDLTQEQMVKLQNLLDKLDTDNSISADEKLKKISNLLNKYRRNNAANKQNKQNKQNEKQDKQVKSQQPNRSGRRRTNIILDENDIDDNIDDRTNGRKRGSSRQRAGENNKGQLITGKNKQCRSEEVYLSGKNKFDAMKERNASKGDIKIDRLLWGDSEPEPRRDPVRFIKVRCRVCNSVFETNPAFISVDDDGVSSFICDGCCIR